MITRTATQDTATSALIRVSVWARVLDARDVRITGDFNGWSEAGLALDLVGRNRWHTILTLAPGEYEYRLLIDGQWADHAECMTRVPNAYGSQNCVLVVV